MAKSSMVSKNNKRIELVAKLKKKRDRLKKMIKNRALSIEERFVFQRKLQALPRNSMKVRIRHRCAITGRPRGFYRHFSLCRHQIRKNASEGLLPGLIKSSW